METRYVTDIIIRDLSKKMVFLAGPRQVGKTTLGKQIIPNVDSYLNWDIPSHRERILKRELPPTAEIFFDEIHKYRQWRNYLKGVYDEFSSDKQILVTGSARLDYYRYGGDSLQGRYHFLRLHPLSVAELQLTNPDSLPDLLRLGCFPEPFFEGSDVEAQRWSREYRTRLIQEELTSVEHILNLGMLELLALRLPDLVGSPLSINALREDLQVSFKTVANWLKIFEQLYMIFRLPPFGAPHIRAVKKEQKHYHFDIIPVKEEAKRFENLVALHLLKWVHYLQDTQGRNIELRYFRDVDGREVDFVLVEDGQATHFIEAKLQDDAITKGLKYLKVRFPGAEAWQISATGTKNYLSADGIRVCPALLFLKQLV